MCGRFTLAFAGSDPAQIRARFALDERVEVRRRFNVAPGDDVLAVVREDDADAQGTSLRWGLVAPWADDPRRLAAKTINARAETVAQRPAYREAFAKRRCLIVADGFYEWSAGAPHWISLPGGAPFAFAGLWASWRPRSDPGVEPLRSCAIVTRAAAGAVRELHHRMPLILCDEDESRWIDPRTPAEQLNAMLAGGEQRLTARRVSRAVNDARHDAEDCLGPPEQSSLFQL